jgi:hypothetical protein
MRRLTEALHCTAAFTPERFAKLVAQFDPEWITEALDATGCATLRRRRLPMEQVTLLVVGMALMRDRPIAEVARTLEVALPAGSSRTTAPSALVKARQRLGADPLEWLFGHTAAQWGHDSATRDQWRGLALYAVDGSTLRVPDTDANREHFGGQSAGTAGRGDSGYPLMRLAVLIAVRSHVLVGASFGPYSFDERVLAVDLWPLIPDDSLTLLDRGYLQANVLVPLATGKNRHWLTRAKSTSVWRRSKRLGAGDELVEMTVSSEARRKDPTLPLTFPVRAIKYQRKGFAPQILLTSLLDARRYPAKELRVLYHERWEIELAYDELKTEMLDREEAIRSKSPTAIAQELWGILLAYNLVRREMEAIADEVRLPPLRISFVAALRFIVEEFGWAAITQSPGAIPRHMADLRDKIRRFVLPPRRERPAYPRAVKVKMSNYALNRRRKKPAK